MTKITRLYALVMGLLVLLLTFGGTTQAAAISHKSWRVIPSPNLSSNSNVLNGVAVVSAKNVLAVGYYVKGISKNSLVDQTLVEQWNGNKWQVVPSPNADSGNNVLTSIAVVSASNAWAVGYHDSGNNTANQTLTEQWNGSMWSVIPSPNTGTFSLLSSIAGVSATNLWAVGSSSTGTLVELWNGSAWSIVPSASPGTTDNKLLGVTAVSANDVVAVGTDCVGSQCGLGGGMIQTLVEQWKGSTWNVVPSPNIRQFATLNAVTALSASNFWAVGSSEDRFSAYTLTEHWNGSTWSIVPSPNSGTGPNTLLGVTAVSKNNVTAVGISNSGPSLIEHWNGSLWNLSASPNPAGSQLNAVAQVPSAHQLWAVGTSNSGTLTERYS